MSVTRVAVVGTGLIGASVGLAARAAGMDVTGWDADPDSLDVAAERGAVAPARSMEEAVGDADLALVATPVATLPAQVEAVLGAGGVATVTDVGSTKEAVCVAASDRRRFVGGHPVAGSEARGPAHA